MYADVILDVSTDKLDHPLTYSVPDFMLNKVHPGVQVIVPLKTREEKGFVVDLHEKTTLAESIIKPISCVDDNLLSVEAKLLNLAYWIKETYPCRMQQAIKTVLPVKKKINIVKKKNIVLKIDREKALYIANENEKKNRRARARLLKALLENDVIPLTLAREKLGATAQVLNALSGEGIIELVDASEPGRQIQKVNPSTLNKDQEKVVGEVAASLNIADKKPFLLHGVTGSGKTVCYIEMAKACVEQGRSVIVLIPEISLTYQTLIRFYEAFGNRVGVINSKQSDGEKYETQMQARNGEIDVVIGPRSALFTPFPNLGLIIIDEEHETSYKSEGVPKYSAINAAIHLAELHGASVVLGSATPSVESYYRAEKGEYNLLTLSNRAKGHLTDDVNVVDLREELKNGNRSIFSDKLAEALVDTLNNNKQAMLFINRRGVAGFVSCRACGHVFKCPHCDVSLSEHYGGKLVCHYCGYTVRKPDKCPECGSKYVLGFKAGTEAVEEKLKELLPGVKTLRMDRDTTQNKGDYDKIITAFMNREADILIGTQMIVKGHDFENVSLVGILAADLSLHTGDFTAAERTFNLLTQAVGRAGRGEGKSMAVIQTYSPDHYAVRAAAAQDYEAFYREEILFRELAGYPPAEHLLMITSQSANSKKAENVAEQLAALARTKYGEGINSDDRVMILGPQAAKIEKINDIYRYVFYMKHPNSRVLKDAGNYLEEYAQKINNGVEVGFDFDPVNTI